jgi:hypothetical protein
MRARIIGGTLVGLAAATALTTACSSPHAPKTVAAAHSSAPAKPSAAAASPSAAAGNAMPAAASYTAEITNAWYPLKAGTTFVYEGTKDGKKAVDQNTVTSQVQTINGVPCRVILDKLYLNGRLEETTKDYYTQDNAGNVWYFGEDTVELDAAGNVVGTEGTWHAGEAGARPGIFMPAQPTVGQAGRQEYYPGHAEDQFQVLDTAASVKVPYRSFTGALLTKEWTPLEPDVLDHKYYAQGVGMVKEMSVKGPVEELHLVSIHTA